MLASTAGVRATNAERHFFGEEEPMRRRDILGLLAGAALPWPRRARAAQALLEESVGFTGQILFLATKVPALVLGVVQGGQMSIQGFGARAEIPTRPQTRTRCCGSVRSPRPSRGRFSRAWPRMTLSP